MHGHLHLDGAAMRIALVVLVLSGAVASEAHAQHCGPEEPPVVEPPNDRMSDTRVLRRILLGLTGTTPTVEQYEALAVAAPAEREALLADARRGAGLDEVLRADGALRSRVDRRRRVHHRGRR